MARPRKIGLDYFPHDTDARHDLKIIKLRTRAGWAGVGLWWSLLEVIYGAGGSLTDGDDGAAALGISRRYWRDTRSLLLELGLLVAQDGVLSSSAIERRFIEATRRRVIASETPTETTTETPAETRRKPVVIDTQSKAQKSTEKETAAGQHLDILRTLPSGIIRSYADTQALMDLASRLAAAGAPPQASTEAIRIFQARSGRSLGYLEGILRQALQDGSVPTMQGNNGHSPADEEAAAKVELERVLADRKQMIAESDKREAERQEQIKRAMAKETHGQTTAN